MKTTHLKFTAFSLLCLLGISSSNTFAQSNQPDADPLAKLIEQSNQQPQSNDGLIVNEIRIQGRRDSVEVQRKNGRIDYYSERAGLFGADEGEELGNRSALRTWRFGN